MRELSVRLYQRLGYVDVRHIPGKRNVADIFTKEIKDPAHFRSMAFTLTTPCLLADWDSTTGESLKRGDRGVSGANTDPLCNSTDPLCNIGGAKDLAAYTHSPPTAIATKHTSQ
jgi:hypothetical protein